MKNKTVIILLVLVALLVGTGIVVYKAIFAPRPAPVTTEDEEMIVSLPEADSTISVDITKSAMKDNTVVLSVKGLGSKYEKVSYELSYDTQGVVQGVTSAPVDISGKNSFVRDDIYLGTCSRNVCKPHPGVTKISAVLVFTDADGQKSQFSKEYAL